MSKKIIGVYPMFNTGGICVHAIDDAEDKVLASVNGENPEWCEMAEQPQEDGDEMESGFLFGSFFVAFSGVMFHDKSFIQALKNTAKLMAVVPVITIFCSLVLAFVLNQCKLKERVLYRTIFYFPNIVSLTVVGIIWSFVFHPNVGIINKILGAVGLESLQRSWLGDSKTALWCIAFTLLWQAAGYYMVMHIAAMDGISPEIYESATLDGASAWRKLVSITMPLMKDIIGITFVLALSGTINLSFVLSQVMTGGGPNGASSVLLQYMYTQGFVNGNFGYAMAITVFTLAISVALSMLSRKLTDASEGGQ